MATSNQVELPLLTERPNAVVRTGGPQLLRGLMLPMPPSANRYWRTMMMRGKGFQKPRVMTYLSEDAKAYRTAIGELALVRAFRFGTEKPLRMEVLVCPATRAKSDIENRIKQLNDALQDAGVFVDDAQIEDLHVRRGPVMKDGRIIISLWTMEPNQQALLTAAMRGDE